MGSSCSENDLCILFFSSHWSVNIYYCIISPSKPIKSHNHPMISPLSTWNHITYGNYIHYSIPISPYYIPIIIYYCIISHDTIIFRWNPTIALKISSGAVLVKLVSCLSSPLGFRDSAVVVVLWWLEPRGPKVKAIEPLKKYTFNMILLCVNMVSSCVNMIWFTQPVDMI